MIKLKTLLTETDWDINQLIPAADIPARLYHATFEELINSIVKNGLIPAKNSTNFSESDKNFVYLGDSVKESTNLMRHLIDHSPLTSKIGRFSGKINVLTISTAGLDKRAFFHDPASQLLSMNAYMYKGIIPSKNIIDYGD